jgi:hypothetical protein
MGRYKIKVSQPGFSDATRSLTTTIGAAFDLDFSLTVAALDTNITVNGDSGVLEEARSQIAGAVSQTEVGNLPLQWTKFPQPRALDPRVTPRATIIPRNVRGRWLRLLRW